MFYIQKTLTNEVVQRWHKGYFHSSMSWTCLRAAQAERSEVGMTALAGLPLYLNLAKAVGLSESIQRHVRVQDKGQGWTDGQVVMALIMLNLAGGEHGEDLRGLEQDEGRCRILRQVEMHGLNRKVRRALERRWRKERRRTVPSTAVFRYLAAFHEKVEVEERVRRAEKAFIPKPNVYLAGLAKLNEDLVTYIQSRRPQKAATLDMDATLRLKHCMATSISRPTSR